MTDVEPEQETGPLCWPVDWSCADPDWLGGLDEQVRARAEALATTTLRALTGYQIGGCPVTVRPCAEGCEGPTFIDPIVRTAGAGALGGRVGPWWPHINAVGNWVNSGCGCTGPCSCSFVPQVRLPGIVGAVTEVLIDGAVLDPGAYRVDDVNVLVRTDGGVWPPCQHMARPLGQDGTFGVTYIPGYVPDEVAQFAAGKLAIEFAKACGADGVCNLPSGVQSISRLGVTYDIPTGMFVGGVTGIIEVDAFIRTWNPNALTTPPRVWSPELSRTRHTVWPAGGRA